MFSCFPPNLGHPGFVVDGFVYASLSLEASLTQELAHEKEHHTPRGKNRMGAPVAMTPSPLAEEGWGGGCSRFHGSGPRISDTTV
jgi:hypothetical protein